MEYRGHGTVGGRERAAHFEAASLTCPCPQAVHIHQPCAATIENLKTQLKNTEEDRDLVTSFLSRSSMTDMEPSG